MPKRLIDFFVVVGVDRSTTAEAKVVDRYPQTDWPDSEFPTEISMFCVPLGVDVSDYSVEERTPHIFSFTITGSNGEKKYAYALQYYELFLGKPDVVTINEDGSPSNRQKLYAPITLCIICGNPFFVLYEKILREIYNYYIHDSVNYKENESNCYQFDVVSNKNDNLNKRMNKNKIPIEILLFNLFNNTINIQNNVHLFIDFNTKQFSQRIPSTKESLPFISDEAFLTLFNCLTIDNILLLYKCLLLEQHIVLHSKKVEKLTLCSEAVLSLLFPFKWVNPYISILPISVIECLETPTPILVGMHSFFLETEFGNEAAHNGVLVYLDTNQIYIPERIKPHIYSLPLSTETQLYNDIKSLSITSSYKVIDSSEDDSYCLYDISFGPGQIGIRFQTDYCMLSEDSYPENCLKVKMFDKLPSGEISPAEKNGHVAIGSHLVGINGESVRGWTYEKLEHDLKTLSRPITLRFQNGIKPSKIKKTTSNVLKKSLFEDNPLQNQSSTSQGKLYNDSFIDKVRVAFLQCNINLLGDYKSFIIKDSTDVKYPFDKEKFISSLTYLNENDKKFIESFIQTQSFFNFIQEHEKETSNDNSFNYFQRIYENLKSKKLLNNYPRCFLSDQIYSIINRSNWRLTNVIIPDSFVDNHEEEDNGEEKEEEVEKGKEVKKKEDNEELLLFPRFKYSKFIPLKPPEMDLESSVKSDIPVTNNEINIISTYTKPGRRKSVKSIRFFQESLSIKDSSDFCNINGSVPKLTKIKLPPTVDSVPTSPDET